MLGKYINTYVFLISLAMGLLLVYMFQSKKRTIVVYPHPDNSAMLQYKDHADTCFEAIPEEVECTGGERDYSFQQMSGGGMFE
jgi:hypothetical protein